MASGNERQKKKRKVSLYRLSDCITDPGITDLFILTEAAYMSDRSAGPGGYGSAGRAVQISRGVLIPS